MRTGREGLRRSTAVLALIGGASVLLLLAGLQSLLATRKASAEAVRLTRALGLSDLALFTEARYTRHPSQADLHTSFQDHPFGLDHFPTGSLISPNLNLPKTEMRAVPPGDSP